jgi:predicted DNA-binding transcriptional regulator AlpA
MSKLPDEAGNQRPRLTQFVGVKEVYTALGISRSTLDRMRRDGGFPVAEQISPNRVGWRLEIIESFRHAQFKQLATHAVEHAEDLSPDEMEDKALGLIVKSLERRSGKPIDPSNLAIHMTNPLSWDEGKAAEADEFARLAERFANLDQDRAYILAAWLFAPLRSMFEGADGKSPAFLSDPAAIEALGRRAMHDEDWEALEAEWLARRQRD